MAETNHAKLLTFQGVSDMSSPIILKTGPVTQTSSDVLLSRSLPIDKKNCAAFLRHKRDGTGNRRVLSGNRDYEEDSKQLINNHSLRYSDDGTEHTSVKSDLLWPLRFINGKGPESKVKDERTDELHESNLSISTLSLSSANEADLIFEEDDSVTGRFWNLLASDIVVPTDMLNNKNLDSEDYDGNRIARNGTTEKHKFEINSSIEETDRSFRITKEMVSMNGKDSPEKCNNSTKVSRDSIGYAKRCKDENESSVYLTNVTDISLGFRDISPSNIDISRQSVLSDMGNSSGGTRYQSTPKYEKRLGAKNDASSVSETRQLNNERLAREFFRNIMIKRDCRCKAKAWVKWTTVVKRRAKERIRVVFARWKEIHLQMKRESLSLRSSQRKEMKQQYYEWKTTFDAETRTNIAAFHFKLSILTRCLQIWKVYIAERRVKAKMNKLARLHFEFHTAKKLFIKWRDAMGRSSVVTRAINKRLLLKVFNGWRKWTQYARMLHKRHLSSCKEYYNRTLLKTSFDEWRYQLNLKLSLKHRIVSMQRRAFTLWQLKYQRIMLRRRISVVHSNMILQRKYFITWKEFLNGQVKRREIFVEIFHRMQLRDAFATWKLVTNKYLHIKDSQSLVLAARSHRALRKSFFKWRHRVDVIHFEYKVANGRTSRNIRNAAMKWRGQVIEKKLQQKLTAAAPFFEFLKLKRIFRHWLREKQRLDREKQRSKVIASIINRGCVARVFTEWRIVTQEDGTIRHMVSRIHRRNLARAFDGWRLIITRKKVAVHYRRIKELEEARAIIRTWKGKFLDKVKERESRKLLERNLLTRVIAAWKEFARDAVHRRMLLAMKYFNSWQRNCIAKVEARERKEASLANRWIVLKTRFRLWTRLHDKIRKKRIENEAKAKVYGEWVYKMKSLKRWRRQFHIHCIVSEYSEDKRITCLDNAFSQWKEFVRQQLQDAVGRFTDRLERESPRNLRNHTLSESYLSGDIPLLRSSSGYFGSLPNIARMSSPLPISPLATERSVVGRDSPVSISPVHPYDHSPRSVLLERSHTFSSPANEEKGPSFERSRSMIQERSKSPHSLQSSGNYSNRTKSPFIVPPLFTNGYKTDDEEYTELTRPKSLPTFEPLNQADLFSQKEKSTDDETPSSVYGQNFDEDAISCYSFRSGSNGVNREHFISGTIRHWRYLPLSKTFRAWYKYTQDKKLRIELFNHFISCKNAWTLRTIFLAWHRKLYCRLASEKFARLRLLKGYFRRIYDNFLQEKSKRERNLIAILHLKNTRLSATFKSWRGKVSAKKRLHSLVGRWQEAVHISETDKMKSDKMIKKKEYQILKNSFRIWKSMCEKMVAAKELSDVLLTKRVLRHWRRYVVKKKMLNRFQHKVTLMRSRKIFSRWKQSYYFEKVAQDHITQTQFVTVKVAFCSWMEWTRGSRRLSSQAVRFQRRTNLALVAKAFFVWSEETSRLRVADDHYKETILIRIIDSWHEYTERKLDLAVRLQDYGTSSTRTKLRNVFDWWKRSAICSGVFKERQKLYSEALLSDCFLRWKKDVQKSKSERHLKHTVLKRAFLRWSHKCFMLNRQRWLAANAARKWLLKAKVNQSLERKCIIYAERKEKMSKETAFFQWLHATEQSRTARAHFEITLVSKVINFWHEKTMQKRVLRRNRESTERIVELSLMSSAFCTWLDQYRRRRKYETVLDNYLELKQQEMLSLCLTNFKINALNARCEKFRRISRQRKVWSHWIDGMHQRHILAKIKKRWSRMVALKYARRWRKNAKDLVALGLAAEQHRMKRDSILVRKQFQIWLVKTRARSLAKMCFESHLLKSTFIQWKNSTKLKLSRKAMLHQFRQKREMEELRRVFQKWTKLKVKLEKEKKLEEVHEQIARSHFRKALVEKCFYSWRNECRIDKICRKRDLKVCAEYFRIWKNECLGGNRAEKMYHQNLVEKAWKKWRRNKITEDVMRAMDFHENRKRLSEVFSAWYNYTYIQRGAIKDFQRIKMRIVFRKWMQEYNKS